MDLLKLFETLENKVDEATKELEKTKISKRKFSIILSNLDSTLGILKNAQGIYNYFNNSRNDEQEPLSDEMKFLLNKEYSPLHEENPKIAVFKSKTCSPCNQLMPILEEASQSVVVDFIDVEDDFEHALDYSIQSFPTIFFLDNNGRIKDIMIGYRGETSEDFIKKALD